MLSYLEFITEKLHKSSLLSHDAEIKIYRDSVSICCVVYKDGELIGYFMMHTYGNHYTMNEIFGKGIQRLEELREELNGVDTSGFKKEKSSIESNLKNVSAIPKKINTPFN